MKSQYKNIQGEGEIKPLLDPSDDFEPLRMDPTKKHLLPSKEERRKSLTPTQIPSSAVIFEEYKDLGEDLDKDIQFYLLKLKVYEEENDQLMVAEILTSIGNSYYNAERFEESIDYYDQALSLFRQIPNENVNIARSLTNLGNSFYNLNQFDEAIEYYKSSFVLFDSDESNIEMICRSVSNLGNAYFNLGNYEDAIAYYDEVKTFCREIGDLEGEKTAYTNLGNCYFALKDFKTAMELYEKRLEISNSLSGE
eukprot:gene10128-2547_t